MDNIYRIKTRLALLKKEKDKSFYRYRVGNFSIVIYTFSIQEHPYADRPDNILDHDYIDVYLYQTGNQQFEEHINLETDPRFKNYKPIKYGLVPGLSSGVGMPMHRLCELIKYLHKLTNNIFQ